VDALIIIAPETVHQQTGQELGFLAHPEPKIWLVVSKAKV
jgi:hypothetical protein